MFSTLALIQRFSANFFLHWMSRLEELATRIEVFRAPDRYFPNCADYLLARHYLWELIAMDDVVLLLALRQEELDIYLFVNFDYLLIIQVGLAR